MLDPDLRVCAPHDRPPFCVCPSVPNLFFLSLHARTPFTEICTPQHLGMWKRGSSCKNVSQVKNWDLVEEFGNDLYGLKHSPVVKMENSFCGNQFNLAIKDNSSHEIMNLLQQGICFPSNQTWHCKRGIITLPFSGRCAFGCFMRRSGEAAHRIVLMCFTIHLSSL